MAINKVVFGSEIATDIEERTVYRIDGRSQKVNRVVFGINTIMDITDTTATAGKIASGYTAYGANGVKVVGTLVQEVNELEVGGATVEGTAAIFDEGGSGGMNFQTVIGGDRVNTTSYSAVSGQSITVAVSGKYTISWTGFRSSTGGTNGSQLYIDDTAQGNVNTTFSNNIQINELTNITLNKNQVVTVRARARGTSYYMYVSNLTIRQTA